MNRFTLGFTAAMFLIAGSALAAGPTTHTHTLNLTGTGAPPANPADVDLTTGACNVDPWVHQCSVTNCNCLEITVTKASGNMDKGTQAVSNFFVTADNDINPATEPTVSPGPNPRCSTFRGILTDTSSTETKTLNLIGVSCKKVIGISSINPQGNHVGDTIVGGWGLSNSPSDPSPLASGWGTLSGFDVKATSAVSLKISGLVTQ